MGHSKRELWFTDRITENERHLHKIKKWIVRKRSKLQKIAVAESFSFGKFLVIDNDLQSSESDEFIYHEALVHPAMVFHGNPKRVLILGGGEGATLREVLKYKTVKKTTMVDIDNKVVEFCKKYMPQMSVGAFEDKRADVVIGDAKKYVEETNEKFDVIISDLCSPVEKGPAYLLYTKEFYEILKQKLTPKGIFAAQIDSCSPMNIHVPASINKTVSTVFSISKVYTTYIPSFDSLWGFLIATDYSKKIDASKEEIDSNIKNLITAELNFYDGQTHIGMFALPKYINHELESKGFLITKRKPVFIY
jgi:spermidine synthase